ncbi:MAG TPA: hypothetical protein DIC42_07240 [Holosporales bacterium]|nr:hypothetical protein [Holosporales bacterium]
MSYKIKSYTENAIRYLLLFTISGIIIYFFILENQEKEIVNHWFGTIQNTAVYGVALLRDLFNKYLW